MNEDPKVEPDSSKSAYYLYPWLY